MKKIRRVIIIFCLVLFYCYFINISNFPNKILVYNNTKVNFKLCPFLKLEGELLTSTSGKSSKYDLKLVLGNANVKDVELKRTEKIEVVPSGELVGLKIFTKGIVIVGFSEIEDINGNKVSIEEVSSLKQGEKILEVNDVKLNSIDDLKNVILSNKDDFIKMKIENKEGKVREELVKPIHDSSNSYKLGIWVKDAATGVRVT